MVAGGSEVGSTFLSVIPSMRGLSSEIARELNKSTAKVGKTADMVGKRLSDGIADGVRKGAKDIEELERQMRANANKTAIEVEKAREKQADAVKKVEIAEKRLNELEKQGKKDSSQYAAAEDRLTRAKRAGAKANGELTRALAMQAHESKNAKEQMDDLKDEIQRTDAAYDKFKKSFKGKLFSKLGINDEAFKRVNEKANDLQDKLDDLHGDISLDINNVSKKKVKTGLAFISRPRVVELLPKVSKAAAGKALATLATISGLGSISQGFSNLKMSIEGAFKSIPKIAALATSLTGLSLLAGAGAVNLLSLAGSLLAVAPAALALPGILGGVAAGVLIFSLAMADAGKYLDGLGKKWQKVQKAVSKNFWAEAAGPIRQLANELFPELEKRLGQTATALGSFTAAMADSLKGKLIPDLEPMFNNLTKAINIAKKATDDVAEAIATLGRIGSEYLPVLAQFFVDIAKKFNNFVQTADKNGDLKRWIDTGIEGLKDLGRVASGAFGIVLGLTKAAEKAGGSTLKGLADSIQAINRAINSPQGQENLVGVFRAMIEGADQIKTIAGPAVTNMFNTLAKTAKTVIPLLATGFGTLVSSLATALSSPGFQKGLILLSSGLTSGLIKAAPYFTDIGNGAGALFAILGTAASKVLPLFAKILGRVGKFLSDNQKPIQDIVSAIGDAADIVWDAIQPIIDSLSDAMPRIAAWFGDLKDKLEDFAPTLETIATKFGDFITWASKNPGKVVAMGVAIAGLKAALTLGKGVFTVLDVLGPLLGKGGKGGLIGKLLGMGKKLPKGGLIARLFGVLPKAPIVLAIAAGVVAIGAAFVFAYKHSEKFRNFVNNLWAEVKAGVQPLVDFFNQYVKPMFTDLFKGDFAGAWDKFKTLLDKLPSFLNESMTKLSGWLTKKGGEFLTWLWNGLKDNIPKFISWVQNDLPGIAKNMIDTMTQYLVTHGPDIMQGLLKGIVVGTGLILVQVVGIPLLIAGAIVAAAGVLVYAGASLIGKLISGMFSAIGKKLKPIGTKIRDAFLNMFRRVGSDAANFGSNLKKVFTRLKDWVAGKFRAAWSKVKSVFTGPVEKAKTGISKAIQKIRDTFTSIKNWVVTKFNAAWAKVKGIFTGAVEKGRAGIASAIAKIRKAFDSVKNWVASKFRSAWSHITGYLKKPVDSAKTAISTTLDKIKSAFSTTVSNLKKVWDTLKSVMSKPIKAAIDFVNVNLIGTVASKKGINYLLGKLDAPTIEWIKTDGFATGGYTGPGAKYQPAGLVHADEFVVNKKSRRQFEKTNPGYLDYINDTGMMPGYAMGGMVAGEGGGSKEKRVWPTNTRALSPNYNGHSGVDIRAGMGAPIYATESGKITRASFGSFGQAIIEKFNSGLSAVYGHTSKLLVKAGQSVSAGQRIGLVGSTGNSTGPHLHLEVNSPGAFGTSANRARSLAYLNGSTVNPSGAAGGGGGEEEEVNFWEGLLGKFTDPMSWIKDKISGIGDALKGFGNNPLVQGLKNVPGMILDKAGDWFSKKITGGAPDVAAPGGSGVERWRGTIEKALAANKLPTDAAHVNAWLRQVQSESGGNEKIRQQIHDVNSTNGSGGAMGLLQTIPPTFNAYKFPGHGNIFNGYDNALAAINYAKHRYGKNWLPKGHGYAAGGSVAGPGTGTSDSILAHLSDGEFVVNAKSARLFRPLLELINKGKGALSGNKFAKGGTAKAAPKLNFKATSEASLLAAVKAFLSANRSQFKSNAIAKYTVRVNELKKSLAGLKKPSDEYIKAQKTLEKANKTLKEGSKKHQKSTLEKAAKDAAAARKTLNKLSGSTKKYTKVQSKLKDVEQKLSAARKIATSKGLDAASANFVKKYKKQTQSLAKIAAKRKTIAAKLKAAQAALTAATTARTEYKTGITDTYKGIAELPTEGTSVSAILKSMRSKLQQAKNFLPNLKTLKKYGLNKTMLQQLVDLGPVDGGATAAALVKGGLTGIRDVNDVQKQILGEGTALANWASSTFGLDAAVSKQSKAIASLTKQDKAQASKQKKIETNLNKSAQKKLQNNLVSSNKASATLAKSKASTATYVYVENPFGGGYILAETKKVAQGEIKKASKAAKTARK